MSIHSKTTSTALRLFVSLSILMVIGTGVFATSAQIGGSEPSLPVGVDNVEGGITVALVEGSDLYDLTGDIGATVPAGSLGNGELYFFGDLLTWVDIESNSEFEPRRIAFTLETGYNQVHGSNEYRIFVKHQSFHDVDFSDEIDESYELYGVNYRMLRNPEIGLRVGKYVNTKDVDYDWDYALTLRVDASKVLHDNSYLTLWLHRVTEKDDLRDGFTDYAAELGFPMQGGFLVFARYEFLHDVDRFGGIAEHHVLIGPRYQW